MTGESAVLGMLSVAPIIPSVAAMWSPMKTGTAAPVAPAIELGPASEPTIAHLSRSAAAVRSGPVREPGQLRTLREPLPHARREGQEHKPCAVSNTPGCAPARTVIRAVVE